jgi:flagellar basal-body rod protein FlgF
MDNLSIAAASGLKARMESLEMLANNLANAATAGYKGDREFYSLYLSPQAANPLSPAVPLARVPVIDRPWTDFAQGTLRATDNLLDVALEGRGFFTVSGPGGALYTRNGSFRLSTTGVLTTLDGHALRAVGGGSIQTVSSSPLEIGADGTVMQDGAALGRLEIVDFTDPSVLAKQGAGYFQAPSGAAPAPAPADAVEVRQGRLEGSNVNAAEGAVRLVNVIRQFETLQKAIALGAEMNKKAVEEVARVG